jgi:hypothetical protein
MKDDFVQTNERDFEKSQPEIHKDKAKIKPKEDSTKVIPQKPKPFINLHILNKESFSISSNVERKDSHKKEYLKTTIPTTDNKKQKDVETKGPTDTKMISKQDKPTTNIEQKEISRMFKEIIEEAHENQFTLLGNNEHPKKLDSLFGISGFKFTVPQSKSLLLSETFSDKQKENAKSPGKPEEKNEGILKSKKKQPFDSKRPNQTELPTTQISRKEKLRNKESQEENIPSASENIFETDYLEICIQGDTNIKQKMNRIESNVNGIFIKNKFEPQIKTYTSKKSKISSTQTNDLGKSIPFEIANISIHIQPEEKGDDNMSILTENNPKKRGKTEDTNRKGKKNLEKDKKPEKEDKYSGDEVQFDNDKDTKTCVFKHEMKDDFVQTNERDFEKSQPEIHKDKAQIKPKEDSTKVIPQKPKLFINLYILNKESFSISSNVLKDIHKEENLKKTIPTTDKKKQKDVETKGSTDTKMISKQDKPTANIEQKEISTKFSNISPISLPFNSIRIKYHTFIPKIPQYSKPLNNLSPLLLLLLYRQRRRHLFYKWKSLSLLSFFNFSHKLFFLNQISFTLKSDYPHKFKDLIQNNRFQFSFSPNNSSYKEMIFLNLLWLALSKKLLQTKGQIKFTDKNLSVSSFNNLICKSHLKSYKRNIISNQLYKHKLTICSQVNHNFENMLSKHEHQTNNSKLKMKSEEILSKRKKVTNSLMSFFKTISFRVCSIQFLRISFMTWKSKSQYNIYSIHRKIINKLIKEKENQIISNLNTFSIPNKMSLTKIQNTFSNSNDNFHRFSNLRIYRTKTFTVLGSNEDYNYLKMEFLRDFY